MSKEKNVLNAEQQQRVQAELALRRVKFLPKQVLARVVDPKNNLSVLGSANRYKTTLLAKRALAAKNPVSLSASVVKGK